MGTPKRRSELDVILRLLKVGLNKSEIRKKLNLKPSALSNHLGKLEKRGLIKRHGKYKIEVLSSSLSTPRVTINQVHFSSLNKRGHAYNFKIIFPSESNLLNKDLVINDFKRKKLEKLNFGSLKLVKDNNSIWINKKSITVYCSNSYYSDNALHSKFRALKDIDDLAIYLKNRYNFIGIYGIEVFREHYGLIFNKFAQWLLKQGKKLYIRDSKGKTILWVDNSRKDDIGLTEFEGESPLRINSADNYFDSHEKTGWKVTPEFTLEAINKVTKNQLMFAENINEHMNVLKDMRLTLKLIRKDMKYGK